jgi:hypothetical protein
LLSAAPTPGWRRATGVHGDRGERVVAEGVASVLAGRCQDVLPLAQLGDEHVAERDGERDQGDRHCQQSCQGGGGRREPAIAEPFDERPQCRRPDHDAHERHEQRQQERCSDDDHADPANPLGTAAFLDADERGELLPAGERLLASYGLNAEFVPQRLGGRLAGLDRLGRLLRPVFSRDAALALGYGASNLVGAVNVWADGSTAQQGALAGLLLAGGRVSAAYTDLATGNDVNRSAFSARRDGDRWLLNGRKEIINNIARAEAITVLARTGAEPGSRSHSLLLLNRAALPRDGYELLPRYRTAGVRAMYLGGMAFRDCAVPAASIVGAPGHALETILRAFQVTRAVLPSAALLATLWQPRDAPPPGGSLRTLCNAFVAEVAELRTRCAALAPRDQGPLAGPEAFSIAHRYAMVLAAAACLGVWQHNRAHPDPFFRDDAWVVTALSRLARRIGRPAGPADPPDSVAAELFERYDRGRAFDLVARAVTTTHRHLDHRMIGAIR